MSEWQPIETAPKDGTKVLAGRFTGKPKADYEGYMAVDQWNTPSKTRGWSGWGRFNDQYWPATHWMPLPAPPAQQSTEER